MRSDPQPGNAGNEPALRTAVRAGRIGVLLVNLGTPEGTDYWSMRRYLKEFLSDRRVIETPRWLWWPLLNLVILTTRPGPKGRDYASIWNQERNEGPLKTITRAQAEKLKARLGVQGERIVVDWGMRYGYPSTAERIEALAKEGCDRLLLVPLYPQYCAATTATACDQAFEALRKLRRQPILRVAAPWHDDPLYIEALASSVRSHFASLDFEPDMVVASFHGIPLDYFEKGDPYPDLCRATGQLLREALSLPPEKFAVTFQSRFGRAEWVKPYTIDTMRELPGRGVKKVAIIAPGFTADCLETREELAVENRSAFLEAGGERFTYIPCLNDSEAGMGVIEAVVRRELKGWL
ncbi:MAG: ferrochelatase [Hyphomicrobiales bacterium]|nr:ferrochelatase [Hyphomicrobiales bacterium]